MNQLPLRQFAAALIGVILFAAAPRADAAPVQKGVVTSDRVARERIAPYVPRFGRTQPVIAIAAQNDGTELTDFAIPYGVLARSGAARLVAVATRPGIITMRPALKIRAQASLAEFDAQFPDGADYVIVPAVVRRDDPVLLAWLVAQSRKGATLVSICDGALVVANSGLLDGHRATAHWATEDLRTTAYPAVAWQKNTRYVADGRFVSSAGISAAMPTALALVEAIAGHDAATRLAAGLGVTDWTSTHDSDRFQPRFGRNLRALAATNYSNRWFHRTQRVGVPIAAGVDEITLAFRADAYSRTGRSRAIALAADLAPVTTRDGLQVLPEDTLADASRMDVVLPTEVGGLPGQALARALAGIAGRYGRTTAFGVALDFEFPDFRP